MATSAVDLCNQALSAVPARQIVSLQENTRSARECRNHYPQAIEEVLESGSWNFQTKRVRLSAMAGYQRGWTHAYGLPADMAYPLRVMRDEYGLESGGCGTLLFDWEGGKLWVNDEEAWLEYVSRDPVYSGMTAQFRRAVIDLLTSRLAVPLTGDTARENQKLQHSEVQRDRANAANLNTTNGQHSTYGSNYVPECLRGWGDGW